MGSRIVTIERLSEEGEYRYVHLEGEETPYNLPHVTGPIPGPTLQPGQRCVISVQDKNLVVGGMAMYENGKWSREICPIDALKLRGAPDPKAVFLDDQFVDVIGRKVLITRKGGVSRLEFAYNYGQIQAEIEIPDSEARGFDTVRMRLYGKDLHPGRHFPDGVVYGAVLRYPGSKKPAECIFYRPLAA